MDLESRIRRFEQRLAAFEKLHTGELQEYEEKLAIYRKLHADEVKMLREELEELKKQLAAHEASGWISSPDARNNDETPQKARLTLHQFLRGGNNPHGV